MEDVIIKAKKDTIFFHMGPGSNAQADAAILSSIHPTVHFWNQPQQKDPQGSFAKLLNDAEAEVTQLVTANGGEPVHIIAHSFGGHLFHQLSLRVPELFKSAQFYSTGYDVPGGFFKLLKVMAAHPETSPELKSKIADFLSGHKVSAASDIWSYIGLIAQDPAFFRHYWPSPNLFSSFVAIASKCEPMDMESFQNILNDFLANYFNPAGLTESPWRGPIAVNLGDKDPLIDIASETQLWKTIFPQAHIKVLENSGHFAHLEKYLKA